MYFYQTLQLFTIKDFVKFSVIGQHVFVHVNVDDDIFAYLKYIKSSQV